MADDEKTVEEAPEMAEAAAEAPAAEAAETVEVVAEAPAEVQPKKAAAKPKAAPAKAEAKPKPKRTTRPKAVKKEATPKERGEYKRVARPVREQAARKERRGIVTSSGADKTIVVRIDSAKPHPKYHKIVRRSMKLHAHDQENSAGVGDTVRIVETKPVSKTKRWRLVEILERAR